MIFRNFPFLRDIGVSGLGGWKVYIRMSRVSTYYNYPISKPGNGCRST